MVSDASCHVCPLVHSVVDFSFTAALCRRPGDKTSMAKELWTRLATSLRESGLLQTRATLKLGGSPWFHTAESVMVRRMGHTDTHCDCRFWDWLAPDVQQPFASARIHAFTYQHKNNPKRALVAWNRRRKSMESKQQEKRQENLTLKLKKSTLSDLVCRAKCKWMPCVFKARRELRKSPSAPSFVTCTRLASRELRMCETQT